MYFSVLGWIAGVKCEQSECVNQVARFKNCAARPGRAWAAEYAALIATSTFRLEEPQRISAG
jgi:hypothetical protein